MECFLLGRRDKRQPFLRQNPFGTMALPIIRRLEAGPASNGVTRLSDSSA